MNLNDETAKILMETIPMINRSVRTEMRDARSNMTPAHFHLLSILEKRSRCLGELAEASSVTMATMSNTVEVVVERGWARRLQLAHDRRLVMIELTDEGRAVLAEYKQQLMTHMTNILANLTPEQTQVTKQGLEYLHQALTKSNSERSCE